MSSFESQATLVYEGAWCTANDDGDCYIDGAFIDQWWLARIGCIDGRFAGVSNGPLDLGTALERAMKQARLAHLELAK